MRAAIVRRTAGTADGYQYQAGISDLTLMMSRYPVFLLFSVII